MYLQLALIYLGKEIETRHHDVPIWIQQNKFKTKFGTYSFLNHSKTGPKQLLSHIPVSYARVFKTDWIYWQTLVRFMCSSENVGVRFNPYSKTREWSWYFLLSLRQFSWHTLLRCQALLQQDELITIPKCNL